MEDKLKAEYAAKGKKGKALAHAVYGTMNAIGAMKGNQETAKGAEMESKHERKMRKTAEGKLGKGAHMAPKRG